MPLGDLKRKKSDRKKTEITRKNGPGKKKKKRKLLSLGLCSVKGKKREIDCVLQCSGAVI